MGVGVMQTKNAVLLEQSAYIKALLSRFGMDKENSVATPVDVNADLVTTSDEVEDCEKRLIPKCCRRVLGVEVKTQVAHRERCTRTLKRHILHLLYSLYSCKFQATVAIALDWPFIPEAGLA
ncbi:hypothetical protein FHG87_020438 [Trinorchestia longiramus]|nr:hypothetical protein FHG87_020438 [Trinorchestia longiramus]